ncbi:PepSY domain-containing protein [Sporosarcina luteola]|uniref:PepSY domain-containing protein n=1 Tax=Sporosarcina luteola TaxID=582850 RepID=UPI00203B9CDA|nr:PepSY domain-containing protein [Sporosarcina luteola]MCM3744387.1 PepSY domain-containing protein [Sporosarcina luteola]
MNIWNKPWFIPIVLTIIIVVAGQLYTSGKLTKAEALPEQEIRSQLAMIYDGEVKDLLLDGSVYKAIVIRAGMEYAVEVDASTSKILSLIQTRDTAKADGDVPDANKAPNTSMPRDNTQKTVLISEKKAEEIALAQLPAGMIGEVDDVDFVNSAEGGYYLVQLDIETTDDMDEVTYQIHAISGKVLTVTWDD